MGFESRRGQETVLFYEMPKPVLHPLPPSPAAIRRVQTLCSPEIKRPERDAITQSSAGVTNEWV